MARAPGQRRRMIDRARASREGRRWHAFYQGCQARRAGRPGNPHPPGTEAHECWQAGWMYAEPDRIQAVPPPACRFGPGGDYVRDRPEEQA